MKQVVGGGLTGSKGQGDEEEDNEVHGDQGCDEYGNWCGIKCDKGEAC